MKIRQLIEAPEEYGVYLNTLGTRESVEVYRGPKAWCLRYMRTMKCPPGTGPVVRSIATTNWIKRTLGITETVSTALFDLTPGGGSRTAKLNGATLIYGVSRDSAEAISLRVSTAAKGTGAAREILSAFCDAADGAGLTVTLGASPLTKATKLSRLVQFYRSLGFELTGRVINSAGDPAMIRHPRTTFQN